MVLSLSSFKRTMGNVRDVLRLDMTTVSPHYVGALDNATTGDGGGQRRHCVRCASPTPEDNDYDDDDDDNDDNSRPRHHHRQATTKGGP
jgi:hypothetical protein